MCHAMLSCISNFVFLSKSRVVYPEDFENSKNLKKTKTPTKTKAEKDVALNDTEVLTLLSFSRTR